MKYPAELYEEVEKKFSSSLSEKDRHLIKQWIYEAFEIGYQLGAEIESWEQNHVHGLY